jgi:hypothetical protein
MIYYLDIRRFYLNKNYITAFIYTNVGTDVDNQKHGGNNSNNEAGNEMK